jgi:uncharacterized protein YndB with AHSA1/START domain
MSPRKIQMSTSTITLHRVLRTKPERVYRAFLDASAMSKWLPPHGFTGQVQKMDAHVGGGWHMSCTNFGNGQVHSFGGEYLALVPGSKLVYTSSFDDASLPGQMVTTVLLTPVLVGTDIHVTQAGIPAVIPPEACYLGWQESLTLLAQLVEADIPG